MPPLLHPPTPLPFPAGCGTPPILLVEDDPDIRGVLAECLEDHGFPIVAVADAEAAIRLLDGAPAPSLVVTDINLGPGGTGLDVAEAARRTAPGVPVVFITGRIDMLRERGLRDGEFVVPKPFAVATLMSVLRRFVAPAAPSAGAGQRWTTRHG